MKARTERIPRLASEAAERRFWESRDSTAYVDWSSARRAVFPNLKPTTRSISLRLPLRLPLRMLERIKAEANSRDVPYQSLIKIWLEEKLSA
jgi:predicted DNA binding CopG/RHH family protein